MSNEMPDFVRPSTTSGDATTPIEQHTAAIEQGDEQLRQQSRQQADDAYAARAGSSYVTAGGSPEEPATRSRKWLWAIPAAAVVVVGGGAAFAYSALSGGGAQPEDVLPGESSAYLRLDIDPSAGQKIAAVRFLNKIPQVGDLKDGDAREKLFNTLKDNSDGDLADVDYAKDIEPWLGDRAGVTLNVPSGGEDDPEVVMAVQVKDEDAAKAGLGKLFADADKKPNVSFRDGYALISELSTAQLDAKLDKGTLATNPIYKGDMAALGEQGVLSGWWDIATWTKYAQRMTSTPAAVDDAIDKTGRVAFALRFEADYLELAGVSRGTPSITSSTSGGLETLPSSTVAALSVPTENLVDTLWKKLDDIGASVGESDLSSQISEIEQQTGLALPEDLKTLLGNRLVVALPDQDFTGSGSTPTVGAKVVGDGAGAQSVVDKITTLVSDNGGSLPIVTANDADALYLSTTQSYLDELKSAGDLGSQEAFTQAVPDSKGSLFSAYVDLDKLEPLYLEDVDADQRELVKALRSVGISAAKTDDGYSFTARLVGN